MITPFRALGTLCIAFIIGFFIISSTGCGAGSSSGGGGGATPTPTPVGTATPSSSPSGPPPPTPTPTPTASPSAIAVLPASVTTHIGAYQSVTALVTGIDNKNVSWSITGGPSGGASLVGSTTCTTAAIAPCTIALTATTAGTYHLTAQSATNAALNIASTITVAARPTPNTTTHPRIWFTSSNISAIQAKAVSTNPIWANFYAGITTYYVGGTNNADTHWSWSCQAGSGLPNSAWITSDQSGIINTEQYAYLFAFLANADPTSSYNGVTWQCRAHDMILWVAGQISSGGTGLGNLSTLLGNRGSDNSEMFGTTVDWIYSSFTSVEKTTIRNAFLQFSQDIVNNISIADQHPTPVGDTNNSAMLNQSNNEWGAWGVLRDTGNNYFSARILELTTMALAFDPADDPTMTNCAGGRLTVCANGSANSLAAYLNYALEAHLYQAWANYEDPTITTAAYNAKFGSTLTTTDQCALSDSAPTPTANCYGNGRGGLSVEGTLYMYSLYRLRDAFLALHTAGYDDPITYGPQLSFATSSFWDLHMLGVMHTLTPKLYPGQYGRNYQLFFEYGDTNTQYAADPSWDKAFLSMLVYDNVDGRTDRSDAEGWLAANIETDEAFPSANANSTSLQLMNFPYEIGPEALLAYPGTSTPTATFTDPRSVLPIDYYSYSLGRVFSRTGWTNNDAIFVSHCDQFAAPDHEYGDCGSFDFYRKGDWVTKPVNGYNYAPFYLSLPEYTNQAAYENAPSLSYSGLAYLQAQYAAGGQPYQGLAGGINTRTVNQMPFYVYVHYDQTGGYNILYPPNALGVQDASRTFLWIKPNYLAIYDRGDTAAIGFKQDWFIATGTPTINSSTHKVTWTTALGAQDVTLSNLLPGGAAISNQAFATLPARASEDYAPQTSILIDGGSLTSARFLNVIDSEDIGTPAASTSLIQSTAGNSFDGTVIGSNLVMFNRNVSASFTSTTYSAPATTTQHYLTNLTPSTGYTVAITTGSPNNTIVVTPGGTVKSDSAGVLTFPVP